MRERTDGEGFATRAIHAGERPDPVTHAHNTPDLRDGDVRVRHGGGEGGRGRPGDRVGPDLVLLLADRQPHEPGARGEGRVARGRRGLRRRGVGHGVAWRRRCSRTSGRATTSWWATSCSRSRRCCWRRTCRGAGSRVTPVDMTDLAAVEAAITPATKMLFLETLDEPAAADRRTSTRSPALGAPPRAHRRRRQHVPRPGAAAADRARRGPRPPRRDEVPLGPRRRGLGRGLRARSALHRPDPQADRHVRPGGEPVRGVPRAARRADAAAAVGRRARRTRSRSAAFLEARPKVEWVRYPGLASHPDHDVATPAARATATARWSRSSRAAASTAMAAFTDHLAAVRHRRQPGRRVHARLPAAEGGGLVRVSRGLRGHRGPRRGLRAAACRSSPEATRASAPPERRPRAASAAPIVRSTRRVTSSSGGRNQVSSPRSRPPLGVRDRITSDTVRIVPARTGRPFARSRIASR